MLLVQKNINAGVLLIRAPRVACDCPIELPQLLSLAQDVSLKYS